MHLATVAAVTDAPQFATVITRDERVRSGLTVYAPARAESGPGGLERNVTRGGTSDEDAYEMRWVGGGSLPRATRPVPGVVSAA